MNLILRLHENYNDPVWSVIISIIILLIGVVYIVVYILGIDDRESNGRNDTTKSEELLQLSSDRDQQSTGRGHDRCDDRSGFDLYKKERVRVAGVDTPEKRTRNLEEKELGIDATYWLKEKLEGAISGDDDLVIRTELVGGVGKYGRLLGWLYIGDGAVSLNEQMITEGYAWAYDGGTKQKDFEELREIRRAHGTFV